MFKKILCVLLSALMLLSTLTCAASATDFTFSADRFYNRTDNQNASDLLDLADKILSQDLNINKKVVLVRKSLLTNEISINADLTSINSLCSTIDNAKGLLSGASGSLIKSAVGDLARLNFSTWLTGMKRGAQDVTIINEIIEFLAVNNEIVGNFIDGSIDLGVVRAFIDPDEILGKDGVSGAVKKMIVSMIYDEETEKVRFDKAYSKALINFDTFIYEDILIPKLRDVLPNFSMNSLSSLDTVLMNAFLSYWRNDLAVKINRLDLDLSSSDSEALNKLSKILVLNGKNISTTLPISTDKKFCDQINEAAGYIVKQLAPKYTGWMEGNYELLGRNITSFVYYIANVVGINTLDKKEAAVAFELLKILMPVIKESEYSAYFEGIDSCADINSVLITVLRNYSQMKNIAVTADPSAQIINILGDILADFVNQYIDIGYEPGTGVDVWTVLNDALNALLFKYDFSKLLGTKSVHSDSAFTKLDEIIELTKMFGNETPEKYKSERFLTKLLGAVSVLDLNSAYKLAVIDPLSDFGEIPPVATLYEGIYNVLRSRFGVSVIAPFSTSKPLHNAISNQSLKSSFTKFLPVFNAKRAELLGTVLKLAAFVLNDKKIENVNIADQIYTGKSVEPSATVRFNGTVLTPGKDYTLTYRNNNKPGTGTATVNGKGSFRGKKEVDFNIKMSSVQWISVQPSRDKILVEWIKVDGADRYEVYLDNTLAATTSEPHAALTDFKGSTSYTVKVRAVSDAVGPTDFASAKTVSPPSAVENLTVKSGFSGVVLKWDAPKGASGYEIEQLKNGEWKRLASVSGTTYTAKTVTVGESCTFRVCAAGVTTGVYGPFTETQTIIFNPRLEGVENISVIPAATMITVYWLGVEGADEYEIYVNNNARPKTAATTAIITDLEPGKQYNIKIRAVNHALGASVFSETATATLPEKITMLKYSVKSDSVTLTWNPARGAEKYELTIDNKLSATTTATSHTLKGFSLGKSYVIGVRAVSSLSGASESALVSVPFPPAKVSGVTATADIGKIALKWTASKGAASYDVEMKDGTQWKKLKTVTEPAYTVTKLETAQKYSFRIKANSPAGSGAYSSTVSATTKLGTPASLKAKSITTTSFKLSWGKVKDAQGYIVEQKVGKEWKQIKKLTTNSLKVEKLSPGTTCKFRVKAYCKKVYSDCSKALSVKTVVDEVKNLKAKSIEAKKVTLTWSKVSGVEGYSVYVLSGSSWKKVTDVKKNSAAVSSLKSKTTYKFKVRAYDSDKKYGGYSKALSVKTK